MYPILFNNITISTPNLKTQTKIISKLVDLENKTEQQNIIFDEINISVESSKGNAYKVEKYILQKLDFIENILSTRSRLNQIFTDDINISERILFDGNNCIAEVDYGKTEIDYGRKQNTNNSDIKVILNRKILKESNIVCTGKIHIHESLIVKNKKNIFSRLIQKYFK